MRFTLFVSCAIAWSLMWAVPPQVHATAGQTVVRDNYARALEFALAVYPGLRTRALGVNLAGDYWRTLNGPIHELRSFTLLIGDGPDPDAPGGERAPILTIRFEFSEDNCIDTASADGPFTQVEKRRRIEALIAGTPGISKDRVSSALRAAGAGFGPSREAELRASVQRTFDRLTPLIERPVVASLYWTQDDMAIWNAVIAGTCNGRKVQYNALFEPFDGKLLGLGRIPS